MLFKYNSKFQFSWLKNTVLQTFLEQFSPFRFKENKIVLKIKSRYYAKGNILITIYKDLSLGHRKVICLKHKICYFN